MASTGCSFHTQDDLSALSAGELAEHRWSARQACRSGFIDCSQYMMVTLEYGAYSQLFYVDLSRNTVTREEEWRGWGEENRDQTRARP